MKEDFSYSRSQYEEKTLIPAKRKARLEMVISLLVVAALAFGYLNARYLHWF